MSGDIEIPYQWHKYYNQAGYFVTYYGDILHGYIFEHAKFRDRFYIVPNLSLKRWKELKSDASVNELRNLAWEIKDPAIITKIYDGNIELGRQREIESKTVYGRQDWKRMFVFGAGASSFCVLKDEEEVYRSALLSSPLGNEIFSKKYESIISNYPGAKLSIPGIKLANNDIEGYYEEEWQHFRNAYNPEIISRHIDIQFYLRDLFNQITGFVLDKFHNTNLYAMFSDHLQKRSSDHIQERAAIVSFNYDTILDHYISEYFGINLNSMENYIDYGNNRVLLFKPHGSCNWGWKIKEDKKPKGNIASYIYKNKMTFDQIYFDLCGNVNEMVHQRSFGIEYEMSKFKKGKFTINKDEIKVFKNTEDCIPALLIPYRDKDDFMMPYNHYYAMKNFMNKIEDLYLIGWKGNEDNFNELLNEQSGNLKRIIIANTNPDEVTANLKKYLDIDKYKIEYRRTFEDLIRKWC